MRLSCTICLVGESGQLSNFRCSKPSENLATTRAFRSADQPHLPAARLAESTW